MRPIDKSCRGLRFRGKYLLGAVKKTTCCEESWGWPAQPQVDQFVRLDGRVCRVAAHRDGRIWNRELLSGQGLGQSTKTKIESMELKDVSGLGAFRHHCTAAVVIPMYRAPGAKNEGLSSCRALGVRPR